MKAYLAAPFGEPKTSKRFNAMAAASILRTKGFDVYQPWEYKVPHAWDYPNAEWGQMVFMNDIKEMDTADIVIVLSYGRNSTAGTNWEAGYAFGIGKRVIVVEMLSKNNPENQIMSLMVANGRYATVIGLHGLREYDFDLMPRTRSQTEQK
jgi:nucleoside 2-deoxyribosyltransferase